MMAGKGQATVAVSSLHKKYSSAVKQKLWRVLMESKFYNSNQHTDHILFSSAEMTMMPNVYSK
jgi:hypothetical protein